MMRAFDTWTYEDVEDNFSIKELDVLPLLDEWVNVMYSTAPYELGLVRLKNNLRKKVKAWNEDELKMFFIAPLLEEVQLENEELHAFTQRSFSVTIGDIEIGGRVDFLIAKGKKKPKNPYFCIHEYKQEENPRGDALGQLLIAMVASQAINNQEMPILGTYIIGRNWFFVVLQGNEYAISREYDASEDDIFQIFAILQKSKEIMMRYV
jgi:hypothetical protein